MNKVIKQMEKVEGDVRRDIRPSLLELVSAAELYRGFGKTFTFAGLPALDEKVNRILLDLSNTILEDIDTKVRYAIAEAEAEDYSGEIQTYVYRDLDGENATNRVDKHTSRLKYVIEAGIAIGFAHNFTKTKLVNELMTLIQNPFYKMYIPQAREDGDYKASYIVDGDLNSGRGINTNIVKSIAGVGTTMIADAFHYGRIATYRRDGAIGYGVMRNSSYDCPDCDDVCAVIHPLTEIVVPVHPNCCCSTFPVFSEDL